MKPSIPDLPNLTKNEQSVLKQIIDQAKIPDLQIAKKMGDVNLDKWRQLEEHRRKGHLTYPGDKNVV